MKAALTLFAALGAVALYAPCSAQGGPPLVTDDPGTVEPRHVEINVAYTAEHRPGVREYETPLVDINYGYNSRTQLKWELPWVTADEGASVNGGLGNSNFGVKWRFRDEDRRGPAISTYPQVLVNNPGSAVRKGLAERGASLFLPIQVQRSFGPFGVNADAGYLFHGSGPDAWSWGIAVGRQVTSRLELLGEIHGDSTRGERDLLVNAGGRLRIAEGRTLLFSAGRSIGHLSEGGASLVAYAGLQFTF